MTRVIAAGIVAGVAIVGTQVLSGFAQVAALGAAIAVVYLMHRAGDDVIGAPVNPERRAL